MMFAVDELARIMEGQWSGELPADGPSCIGHDTRRPMAGGMYVAITGEQHDGHHFLAQAIEAGATMALVEREIPSPLPQLVVADTVVALAKLAWAWRDRLEQTCVIAITGTAGKTTTKDLMHHVLAGSLKGQASPASWNNAIGGPMSLLQARPDDDYIVLEVGTSSPGEIAALGAIMRPDVAVITLVGHGHLEGLGSLDGVRKEKYSLLEHVKSDGLAVVHDDGHQLSLKIKTLRHGDHVNSSPRLVSREGGRIQLDDGTGFQFSWSGQHHAVNALAVIAVARHLALADAVIDEALSTARPSRARGRERLVDGIRFIDDAYNANPDSVKASLAAFSELSATGRRVVLLGDMLELGVDSNRHHEALASEIDLSGNPQGIDVLLLFGEAMSSLLRELGHAESVHHWPSLDERSVLQAADLLQVDDLVLVKGSRGMRLERIIEHIQRRETEASSA